MSKNSGKESWKAIPCYKVTAVQDFAVESADVVYVLDTATGQGVSKTTNAGASWGSTKEPTKTIDGYMITLAPNGDVLVGDSLGYVAFSKDGGSTFERTGDFGTGNAQVVADVGETHDLDALFSQAVSEHLGNLGFREVVDGAH